MPLPEPPRDAGQATERFASAVKSRLNELDGEKDAGVQPWLNMGVVFQDLISLGILTEDQAKAIWRQGR